jgi:predicted phosphoribosyltransferase
VRHQAISGNYPPDTSTTRASQPFDSREEAGRELAKRLGKFAGQKDAIVLTFPDGAAIVGAEVAKTLKLRFDVFFVEKITTPKLRSMPLGAITSGGVRMLNYAMIDRLCLSDEEVSTAIFRKSLELAEREKLFRSHHTSVDVADHTVILVDDGSTPCSSLRNAIRLLRRQHADRIIVAVPAASRYWVRDLRMETPDVITLVETPSRASLNKHFKKFRRTTIDQIRRLLSRMDADPFGA